MTSEVMEKRGTELEAASAAGLPSRRICPDARRKSVPSILGVAALLSLNERSDDERPKSEQDCQDNRNSSSFFHSRILL
jgi:hypothetical protein